MTETITETTTPVSTSTVTATQTVNNNVSLGFVDGGNTVIYPNPSGNEGVTFRFSLTKSAEIIKIRIYSMAYRLVKETEIQKHCFAGSNDVKMAPDFTSKFANGIYYYVVFVTDNKGNQIKSDIGVMVKMR
ncbi:MAG: hypothetical protein CVV21_08105 [Candidatus Goldiibacteriota bacterium HGW-Goldbacteria-1]|nr:MAG: hypothetical protein CVV21_08105 [Candidatus Goldiibacteriota bacterium HGW-Goldbacteria-1]